MTDVQLNEVDGHMLVKGRTRDAVEDAVAALVRDGHQQLDTIRELGNNWIATVRLRSTEDPGWCEVTTIGLQYVIEASREDLAQRKVRELTTYGAVLVAGPECIDGKWIAVVDRRMAPTGRR